jgi:hypothetical protein
METCPHCGKRLPIVVDAFCPDCRGRLDEPPTIRDAAHAEGDSPRASPRGFPVGLLLMVGGIAAMFSGVLALTRGNWPDALYTAGPGVALVIFGAWHSGRSEQKA